MRDREPSPVWFARWPFWLTLMLSAPAVAEVPSRQELNLDIQSSDAQQRVEIHLVGDAAEFAQLEPLIAEWFLLDGLRVELQRHYALQPQDILSEAKVESSVRVWVSLLEERVARLYFSDSSGSRFLLRDVPIRSGLDEMGREQLVHVLVASASAFTSRHASTSKAEVVRSFDVASSARHEPAVANSVAAPRQAIALQGFTPAAQTNWTPRVGALLYTAAQGADKLRWGSGLLLGVRRTSNRSSASLTAKVAYSAVGDEASGPVVLSSNILSLRLAMAADLLSSRGFRGGLEVGGGIDRVAFIPRVAAAAAFSPRGSGVDNRPVATAALSCAWVPEDWRLTLLVGGSLMLVSVHYDITLGGQQKRQLTPWLLQPGAALEASWQ